MQVEVVRTAEELHHLRDEWETLEDRDSHASYYVTHRFVSAWWLGHEAKPDLDLHVLCVRQNHRLVGIAPLVRRRASGDHSAAEVRFASQGDYLGFLIDPDESSDAVCKAVLDHVEALDWRRLALTNVPAESPLAHFLLKSPYNPSFTLHVENPYIDLKRYGSFENYTSHHLPSKVRKYRNKLHRERDVHFRVVHGPEEGLLDRLAELHRREKAFLIEEKQRTERQSLYEDPNRAEHIRRIFERTEDPVTFLYEDSDGRLLAYRTCFRHGRTLLSWNSAYEPDCDRYRIGKVIQYDVLQHLFEDGSFDVFDFGAGRYPWKFEWTDQFTSTYRLVVRRETEPPARPRPGKRPMPVSAGRGASSRDHPAAKGSPVKEDAAGGARSSPTRRARAAARQAGLGRVRWYAGRAVGQGLRRARRPVVWYIPHPDDESIFMGGSIAAARHRRNILVLLTRGGASGARQLVSKKLDDELDAEHFMAARLKEFHDAVRHLGVDAGDVVVHDLPDGDVDAAAVHRIILACAERYPRAEHRTLSYLDPHGDHAAAGQALRRAKREGHVRRAVFHLPIPLVDEALGTQVRLSRRATEAKRLALQEYETWRPRRGRYAIGAHSVRNLIKRQKRSPMERVHDADYEA